MPQGTLPDTAFETNDGMQKSDFFSRNPSIIADTNVIESAKTTSI